MLEKRRSALVEYCIGQADLADGSKYNFLRTPNDLFELLRMDPLDSYAVQSSWVAEATSCAQQYIHAVYRKLEPGFDKHSFESRDLAQWELYGNYPDWAALQMIALYPENFINPFVRLRKSSLFKTLENDLNQTRLSTDSVQVALRNYLQAFEQTCNLDVVSGFMDGASPARADYYFVGRQRVAPFQYFWRRAQVELSPTCVAINPAAWAEWQPVDIPAGVRVLDMRPVFWSGRLCLVWAEWRDRVSGHQEDEFLPDRLDIQVAFMTQNGKWSAPLNVHSSEHDEDKSQGTRLIATVWADRHHPKGKLGILLTNGKAGQAGVSAIAVRDVLFRPVAEDDGGWLKEAAERRFTDTLTVQHPLVNQPQVVTSVDVDGSMAAFLDVQAVAFREGNDDVLVVQGLCRPTGLDAGTAKVTLALVNSTGDDPKPLEVEEDVAGGWSTEWQVFRRAKGAWADPTTFTLVAADTKDTKDTKDARYGSKKFQLTIKDVNDFNPASLLKNSLDAAQFLSLNQSTLTLKFARLNSLFGPELVQRSFVSVDAVLDWDTQFIAEPPPVTGPISEPNGAFNGANGLFFWELFFHLPHLVASRLRAEDRFTESQQWLHYLFDPHAPADAGTPAPVNPKPLYWRCRPLNGPGNLGCETQAPTDPDAIGYSAPRHFQIKVFTEYVSNLLEWGDWYYRQLTRDSLVAAKLCYVQAEFLMGQAPSARTVNRWQADTLGNLLNLSATRPALEQFEQALAYSLADVPAASDTAPALGLLANEPFQIPINLQLLDLFALPGQRLHNLRNNLTLDGKPLQIPLFSPPTDPDQLLRDLASGGAGSPRPMGGRLVVGAFRWRVTYEAALRAVQTLQEHGNQVLRLLEQRDRAEQEELQHSHLVELGGYAQTVQEQSISQLQAGLAALVQSRSVAQERADAYAQRHDENISAVEYDVMANLQASKVLGLVSSSLKPAGAVLASLPNVFGLANGGHRLDKAVDAVVFGLGIAASAMQIDADKQATTEGYRRRRADWGLQRDQALGEVRALDEQINAQTHALQAANSTLAQTLKSNAQALTVYNFLKKRASNVELFGWLLGQIKALHYQAYDAVVSLCLSAQASMAAETGDYDSVIPLPQVWLDNRHGLTAGEHLRGHLLRMEREYLQRHERRLEVVKTVSLRQLFDDKVAPQPGAASWEEALRQLRERGKLEFSLGQLLFDRDHPGHYCRQISSVEVDMPVLTGPYQDIRATLLQISSMVATKATYQSVKYLHQPQSGVAPGDVQINLRSAQQVALSVGLADNGMAALKPDEGLLNPFECTGAVSRWALNFPWPQKEPQASVLASLTDVIVRIRYTARAGEATFTQKVQDLVTEAEQATRGGNLKGANRHG
nr:neuraminidase-like domain-containing protein [Pseudomonas ekonensis]